MHRRLLVAVLAAYAMAACTRDRAPSTRPGEAAATGALRITPAPVVTIFPIDSQGLPLLANVADATRLSSGRIVVVDRALPQVMFFDATGRLQSEVGRPGGGPGEFQATGGVGQCAPDSLFVWDRMNARMSVLDAEGAYIREFRLRGQPTAGYCAGTHEFVVWERFLGPVTPAPDAAPVRGEAVLVSGAGATVTRLGELQAGETRPLGAVTSFAVTARGVYVGTADTALISVYARDGRGLLEFTAGAARRAPSDSQYDAAIAALAATLPGTTADRTGMRAFMRKRFPKPEYLPAYRAILPDPAGRIYVVISPYGAEATTVAVFDPTGRPLGELRIPGDLDVVEVGEDYLLGIPEGPDGRSRVVEYEVAVGEF